MGKVGFIGLGLMGKPMSKNLLKAGFAVTVYSRTRQKIEDMSSIGAKLSSSPKEAAMEAEVVVLMVPDSRDVEEVVLGKNGVIEGIKPGSIVIDMGTISPQVEVRMAEELKKRNVDYLDAPVTGGDVGAAKATLTIMVGGRQDVYEKCLPIFKAMGTNIFHMGPTGSGQKTKIVNQIIVSLNLLATAEGLMFAKSAGLDPGKVIEAISDGAAASYQLTNFGPKMLKHDFEPGFKIAHLQKDLRIALTLADTVKLPMLGTSMVNQLLHTLNQSGNGDKGTPMIVHALEKLAGFEINEKTKVS